MKLQAESLPFPRPPFPSKRGKSGNATVKFALSSVNRKRVPWRDCHTAARSQGRAQATPTCGPLILQRRAILLAPSRAPLLLQREQQAQARTSEAAGAPPAGDGVRTRSGGLAQGSEAQHRPRLPGADMDGAAALLHLWCFLLGRSGTKRISKCFWFLGSLNFLTMGDSCEFMLLYPLHK